MLQAILPYSGRSLRHSWPVPASGNTQAITQRPNSRQAEKSDRPQKLAFHAWLMCRIRLISTSDIFGAWAPFGGMSAQLCNISGLLRLETTENIATAMAYGALLSSHLAESARARAEKAVGAVDFVDLLSTEHARFKAHAVAQCSKTSVPPAKNLKTCHQSRVEAQEGISRQAGRR